MSFVGVFFYLVIEKPVKNYFLSRIFQWKNDVNNAVTSSVNGVIIGIAGKIYIINDKNKSLRKVLNKFGPNIYPCGNQKRISC